MAEVPAGAYQEWLEMEQERTERNRAAFNDEGVVRVDPAKVEPRELSGDWRSQYQPTTQKPMVTREGYDKARAVLDALPAGMYIKCSACRGWYKAEGSTEILSATTPPEYLCRGCG